MTSCSLEEDACVTDGALTLLCAESVVSKRASSLEEESLVSLSSVEDLDVRSSLRGLTAGSSLRGLNLNGGVPLQEVLMGESPH